MFEMPKSKEIKREDKRQKLVETNELLVSCQSAIVEQVFNN
jgi:hypothetical protein